jgi:hypothetical protein
LRFYYWNSQQSQWIKYSDQFFNRLVGLHRENAGFSWTIVSTHNISSTRGTWYSVCGNGYYQDRFYSWEGVWRCSNNAWVP